MPTQFPVYIQGMEGQHIVVQAPSLTAGPKLFVNGMPAMAGPAKNQYVLQLNSGQQVIAQIKPRIIDPVPELSINGITVQIAPPFQWYEWLLAGLPLLLIGIGGAIGGGLGAAAACANGFILRSNMHPVLRIVASISVIGAAVIAYVVATGLVYLAIHGGHSPH